jgi:hypothetical protein
VIDLGTNASGGGGASGSGSGNGPVGSGTGTSIDSCDAITSQARTILETDCASCHGGRTPGEHHGVPPFDFVLDFEKLKVARSGSALDPTDPRLGMRFLIPGHPDDSRIYQRIRRGEMPPMPDVPLPRPTVSDTSLLRDWIMRCMGPSETGSGGAGGAGGGTSGGAAGIAAADASSPPTPDALVDAPLPRDAGVDAPLPRYAGVGAYFTVIGSSMNGTYLLADGASCGGLFVCDLSAAAATTGKLTIETTGFDLAPGVTVTTPNVTFKVQVGASDDGTYPAGGKGTCSIDILSGAWASVRTQFTCSDLVGIGSGEPFSMSGYMNCY